MTKANEREAVKVEHVAGGAGFILKENLLSEEEMGAYCNLFSKVTLAPTHELGYHEHHGETETYYFLKGSGVYDDNGKKIQVESGDVVFCKDGDGHGLTNTGTEDIEFVALILKK